MLDALRKGAGTWVAKLFIAILVMSFAVWGIADMFRGFGQNVVAQVGDKEITTTAFDRAYRRDLATLGQRLGRPLSTSEGAQFGVPQQTLGKLIAEAALDEDASKMNLGISDEDLAKEIQKDPTFQRPGGGYDRALLSQALRNYGMTEDDFVMEQHDLALRQQLAEGISGGLVVPQAYLEMLDAHRQESRTIEYVKLTSANLPTIEEPSDDTLKSYFEDNKSRFKAPEYRKVTLLKLTPEELAKPGDISDEDVSAEYERAKDRYFEPESRHVLQLSFTSEEEASKAAQELADGKTFEDLMAERELKESDVDLGEMKKADFLDESIGDAAFGLENGATSGVVKGRFSSVILKVTGIQPAQTKPYDEVKDEIRKNLAEEEAEREVLDMMSEIEDARAGGATLQEVAERFQLKAETPAAFDSEGKDEKGNTVELPKVDGLVSGAFDSDVGIENDPLQLGTRGFLWYDVTEVIPSHDQELSAVRDQVVKAWKDAETAKRLAALADDTEKKLTNGATLESVATDLGTEVQTVEHVTRTTVQGDIDRNVATQAFSGPVGTVASVENAAGDAYIVLKVTNTQVPAFFPEAQETQQIATGLTSQLQDSILNQYVVHIEDKAGIKVNQGAVGQVIGSTVSP